MIALIDYGAGNVRSVHKALLAVGADVRLTSDPTEVQACHKIVLPGVGAFGDCMASLRRTGLAELLVNLTEQDKPFLGICVGMQVLFEKGEEIGYHAGLGLLAGQVVRFPNHIIARGLKIPHTGWNQIHTSTGSSLFHNLPAGSWAYFNHAYYCQAQPEDILATTDYGGQFPSVVGRGRVYGIQFHPEKSQKVGLQILRNFVEGVN